MLTVELEGRSYIFSWRHLTDTTFEKCDHCGGNTQLTAKRSTECRVYHGENCDSQVPVVNHQDQPIVGIAECNLRDRFVRKIGHNLSFKRALHELCEEIIRQAKFIDDLYAVRARVHKAALEAYSKKPG